MPNDEYRQMLVTQECESSHMLDNSITLVSTGALVISISFLKDCMEYAGFIKASWIFLLLSIGMQMVSYWTSERAFRRQRELYDEEKHGTELRKLNLWSKATDLLNYGLRISFAIGLLLLVIYGFISLT
jgi:hypothetical protein